MNPSKPNMFLEDELYKDYRLKLLIMRFQSKYIRLNMPTFEASEISYKHSAAARVQDLLSQGRFSTFLANGQYEEAKTEIKRACSGSFEGQPNNLLNQYDRLALVNAPAEPLAKALYDLLYGQGHLSNRFKA